MRTQRNGERGVALLLTMFALMIVTAIGFSMMFQTDTETAINSNFRDQQAAYYAAAAGLEEARDRMASDSSVTAKLPWELSGKPLPGQTNGVLYITNTGETIQPWESDSSNPYFDNELCPQTVNGLSRLGEADCSGGLVPPSLNWYQSESASNSYATNPVIPYKWTRINLKRNRSAVGTTTTLFVNESADADDYVCWDGTHEFASSTVCASPDLPVYMLTTLAVTTNGTRRMLQYELARDSLDINVPGALTLIGPSANTSFPTSNVFKVDGNDQLGCGSTSTTSPLPAVAVSNDSVDTTVTDAIPHGPSPIPIRTYNYTGSGGTTPDVQAISMPGDYQTVSSLEALLAKIKSKTSPGNLYTGTQSTSTLATVGTSTSPEIIYVDGNLTLNGNVTGYGVLVVTGTLEMSGTAGWKGIVLVVGKGEVIGTGGGSNQIDGALIVAATRDSSGNLLSTLGTPTFDWSGGGGNGVHYTSGCTKQANELKEYQILSSRELMY